MSTLTMKVPAELAARLEKVSARRRVSKSQVVREALEKALMKADSRRDVSAYDLMKGGFGVVRSGIKDLASNKHHLKGYGK